MIKDDNLTSKLSDLQVCRSGETKISGEWFAPLRLKKRHWASRYKKNVVPRWSAMRVPLAGRCGEIGNPDLSGEERRLKGVKF